MPKHRTILTAALVVVVLGLLAAWLWSLRCPIDLTVTAIEPSGVRDDSGAELLMITLRIRNHDNVDVMFEPAQGFEAKSSVGTWTPVTNTFTIPRIAPGSQASVALLAPPTTSACRLYLHYQTQIWKYRVLKGVGVSGRTLIAKSRLLSKLVWPNQLKTMPDPPHWRQATIEAVTGFTKPQPSPGHSFPSLNVIYNGFHNLEFGHNSFYDKADDHDPGRVTLTGDAYHCGPITVSLTRHDED